MNSDYAVAELVPHSGTMSLLSRVTAYGDDWLEAEVDITSATLFVEENGVPAWVGLEYLAQAIAAFSGVQERKQKQSPKLGFLLGTRRYESNVPWFSTGLTLTVRVEREMVAENGLHVFRGKLTALNVEATANLNVFQPDDASQFIKEAKQ
jgi:predicted hotdog family 3-hydroxylacyl-ACP dehydratase